MAIFYENSQQLSVSNYKINICAGYSSVCLCLDINMYKQYHSPGIFCLEITLSYYTAIEGFFKTKLELRTHKKFVWIIFFGFRTEYFYLYCKLLSKNFSTKFCGQILRVKGSLTPSFSIISIRVENLPFSGSTKFTSSNSST